MKITVERHGSATVVIPLWANDGTALDDITGYTITRTYVDFDKVGDYPHIIPPKRHRRHCPSLAPVEGTRC